MTAATKDRDTTRHGGASFGQPVKANTILLAGIIVGFDSTGFLVAGVTSTTFKASGINQSYVDNTGGADGAVKAEVRRGVFALENSASTDQITNADYGATAYVVDNQTVAKTNGSNTRSAAGVIRGIDENGKVLVEF